MQGDEGIEVLSVHNVMHGTGEDLNSRLDELAKQVEKEERGFLSSLDMPSVEQRSEALTKLGKGEFVGIRFPPWEEIFPSADLVAGNIFAGIIASVKLILGMVVYSSLIFESSDNETLNGNMAKEINIMLFSCGVALLVNALFSRMSFSLASPQDTSTILLGLMATQVVDSVDKDSEIIPTLLFLQTMNAALCALCFFLAHKFKLSKLVLLLPYPVLCAFLGSIGISGIRGALATMSGVPFVYLWPTDFVAFTSASTLGQVACGLAFFTGMLYMGNIKAFLKRFLPKAFMPLVSLLYMFSFPIVFWLLILLVEYSNTFLVDNGWLYEASDSAKFSEMWDSYVFSNINWGVVNNLIVDSLSMTLLIWISSMLNITGIEASEFPSGIDKDGEMLNLALCNFLCCLCGGVPVFHQLGTSITLKMDGGTHRLSPIISAVVVFSVWLAGAASTIQQHVPRFFLGGIFLTIGWSFFNDWLLKSKEKVNSMEYRLIIFCVLISIITGSIMAAIVLSIGLAIGHFLLKLSVAGGVKTTTSSSMFRSPCARTSEEESILDKQGHRILTVSLTGVLFFGSVQTVVSRVRKAIRQEGAEYVILDFSSTLHIDASSADSFKKLFLEVKGAGGMLLFSNLHVTQVFAFHRIGIKQANKSINIQDKQEYYDHVEKYKEKCPALQDIGFDKFLFGIFGPGIDGFNQYPYFHQDGRAKQFCEDDVLHRFLYSSDNKDPGVMAEELCTYSAHSATEISITTTPSDLSRRRMGSMNIPDADFFRNPLCLGFSPKLQQYVEPRQFNSGDRVLGEGEKMSGDIFLIVRQGIVEYRGARKASSCEPGRLLAVMGAGNMIYASGFLAQTASLPDVVAVMDDTIIWVVTRNAMIEMKKNDATLSSMMYSSLGMSCSRHVHIVSGIRSGDASGKFSYEGYEYFQLEPIGAKSDIRGVTCV